MLHAESYGKRVTSHYPEICDAGAAQRMKKFRTERTERLRVMSVVTSDRTHGRTKKARFAAPARTRRQESCRTRS